MDAFQIMHQQLSISQLPTRNIIIKLSPIKIKPLKKRVRSDVKNRALLLFNVNNIPRLLFPHDFFFETIDRSLESVESLFLNL
jgi:hypothetical protein